MRTLILLTSLSFLPNLAFAQRVISFGVKGGVPFTDALSGTGTKNYVIGPMIELKLPLGFAVEADTLYRPLYIKGIVTFDAGPLIQAIVPISEDVHSAEFSILAKYHFLHTPIIKPYAEAGPIFRYVGSRASYLSNNGFALGGGIDFKIPLVRISPEVRFSRWGGDSASRPRLLPPSNGNQAEFLIGLSF
jgi:hypothetical protein